MDLLVLGQGVTVTIRFPGLLPELISYVLEISKSLGYVLPNDCQNSFSEDRTVTAKVILHPSLV